MIYDISSRISPRLKVWPGDRSFSREVSLDRERGDKVTLSSIQTTLHLGTHVDAPSHYGPGPSIDQRDLDYYLGPCQLMRIAARPGQRITPDMLTDEVDTPRLLLATGSYPDPERFVTDFAALSVELVDFLHAKGVKLVGIDTPSVDLFSSEDLEAHRAFSRNDMAILEGVILSGVPAGRYELIALPLKLEGCDGSPVRAVLRGPVG